MDIPIPHKLSPDERAEIDRQLELVVMELETTAASGPVNHFLVHHAGDVVRLLGRADLFSRVKAVPAHDLLSGALTNIDLTDVDISRLKRFKPIDAVQQQYPVFEDGYFPRNITLSDVHLSLCKAGDIEGAKRAAKEALDLEEIAGTLAVSGYFDAAISFIDAQEVEEFRKSNVRFIVLLEKCRRGESNSVELIRAANLQGHSRLHVVLALARYVPWLGYPFPDW